MTMRAGQTDPNNLPPPMPMTGMAGDMHGDNVVKTCPNCGVDITNKATYSNENGQQFCSMSCLDTNMSSGNGVQAQGDGMEMDHMEYVP